MYPDRPMLSALAGIDGSAPYSVIFPANLPALGYTTYFFNSSDADEAAVDEVRPRVRSLCVLCRRVAV